MSVELWTIWTCGKLICPNIPVHSVSMGVTFGAGTDYHPGATFFTPGFNRVRIARSLVCYVQVARSLVCYVQVARSLVCYVQVARSLVCCVQVARSLVCCVQVARSLVCCVMFYTLLFFWPFSIYDFWLPLWCLQTFLPARWSYKYSWQNCSQLSIRRFNVMGSHKGSWRVNKKRHVRSYSICVFEINIF